MKRPPPTAIKTYGAERSIADKQIYGYIEFDNGTAISKVFEYDQRLEVAAWLDLMLADLATKGIKLNKSES